MPEQPETDSEYQQDGPQNHEAGQTQPTPAADGAGEEGSNPSLQGGSPEPQAELAMGDTHSLPAGLLDVHSMQIEEPAPVAVAGPPAADQAPIAAHPAVDATVKATQAAVSTAIQATNQVEAAVQQTAQRITVAPRKAIYRGRRFLFVYAGLVALTGLIAALANRHRYFPADVGVARLIQWPRAAIYDDLMKTVSRLGWRWMSVGTRASVGTLMWAAGFRMESAFTFSTWSADMLTAVIKTRVRRPRPTRDLIHVVSDLTEASFPSGHVVHYVTFYGFLFYLIFTHLKHGWYRTAFLTLLAGVILLVGPSRVYMGQHWPSDVAGAYLVGTLWLGAIIVAYLETKAHYSLHVHPPFFVRRREML